VSTSTIGRNIKLALTLTYDRGVTAVAQERGRLIASFVRWGIERRVVSATVLISSPAHDHAPHQSTMTAPVIPLQWILEYAVTDPSKFKDSFILGISSLRIRSNSSIMRPTCLNTRPASNPPSRPHSPLTPHLLRPQLQTSLRRRQRHPRNDRIPRTPRNAAPKTDEGA
jgi:hypothetical protein